MMYHDTIGQKVISLGYRYFVNNKFLRPLTVQRPLRQGEGICMDQCYGGTPYIQCRLSSDSNVTMTKCKVTKFEWNHIGEGIVFAKNIKNLKCDNVGGGKTIPVSRCSDDSQ